MFAASWSVAMFPVAACHAQQKASARDESSVGGDRFRVSMAGRIAWHVSWLYGGLCMAVFLVRTMKRIIFHEARQYSAASALLLPSLGVMYIIEHSHD